MNVGRALKVLCVFSSFYRSKFVLQRSKLSLALIAGS